MVVNWAELPPEILDSISKSLTIYADYVRFRAVCHSWRSSVPRSPRHLPPQLPWLMLPQSQSQSQSPNPAHRAFFDLSNHKTHLLNLPESSHVKRYCGSSHGWLVILDETPEILLVNPLTRATLSLPPLNTFPNVESFDYSNIGREYLIRDSHGGFYTRSLRKMSNSFIRKVVLSSSPSQSNQFTAFAIVNQSYLAFCKKGDDSWAFCKDVDDSLEQYYWEDAVYFDGLFYAVSMGGSIAVCDIEGPSPGVSPMQKAISAQLFTDIHYTVFSGNDTLSVSRYLEPEFDDTGNGSYLVYRTQGFDVFKMNWTALEWEKIETLGDQMLFIGGNSSLSLSASDFLECSGDCIYYTDDYSESNDDDAYGKHDLGIYRLRDRSIEPLPCYPQNPYSRLGWPLPIWVAPNP